MTKKDLNTSIRINYSIVAMAVSLVVVAIVFKASYISFAEGDQWRKRGESLVKPNIEVPATRGNIYSADGRLMATTEYIYRLYIDFWADGLSQDTLKKYIKPLSVELNKLFPDKSAKHYEDYIMKGWEMREKEEEKIRNGQKVAKRSREYKLFQNDRYVNYLQLKDIRQMPFLCQNKNKSGLISKTYVKRTKPFGSLASRTIGDIYGEFDKGGKNGLELAYDEQLKGIPGTSTRRKVSGRIINVIDVDPVEGKDIISTIDIDIQDITEKALMDKLKEIDAASGTAVVMEVSTGEIKAITNMARIREGVWAETKNHAVADEIEPGSTFKVASMMVALEDKVITPDDSIKTGNGLYTYSKQVIRDHNSHRGGYGTITAAQSIWYSSNVGVAKIILKGYENNPSKYIEGLKKIGLDQDLDLEIPGSGKAYIKAPGDASWSKTSLPWMSFGYETKIPPIYTLTFFNAIANDGKMVKPMFVKEIRRNGKTEEKKKTTVINNQICSKGTLEQIRQMLFDVVNQPTGTGKPARSENVAVAGKTGTAQISRGAAGYAGGGHQVSFCGYFPADKPLYSVIVVIRRPRNGYPSGGTMSGAVVKRIAEEVYAKSIHLKPADCGKDTINPFFPAVKSGFTEEAQYALNKLNLSYNKDSVTGKWLVADNRHGQIVLKDRSIKEDLVPNVAGMGMRDAIYLLENAGLKVKVSGKGKVVSQSIIPGTRISRGSTVTLTLK